MLTSFFYLVQMYISSESTFTRTTAVLQTPPRELKYNLELHRWVRYEYLTD